MNEKLDLNRLKLRCLGASSGDWMAQQVLLLIERYQAMVDRMVESVRLNTVPSVGTMLVIDADVPPANGLVDGYGIPFDPVAHARHVANTLPVTTPPREPESDPVVERLHPAGHYDKGSGV